MRNFFEGKWLGHPLHPLLVHLPIGLFVLSFIFDLLGYLTDLTVAVPGAFYTMALGILTALLAAVPGLVDFSDIRRDAPAKKKARLHMVLNLLAVGLYAASAVLRYPEVEADAPPVAAFLLSLAAIAILSYSGYIGGELVYDEGVGVGRHRRECALPNQTITRPGLPGEFVAVADAEALQLGQTLRTEINGTVIAVANVGGELFAFQEFCTHRYGPLSEGAFRDHHVVCPWHNSCFDLRTGAVAEGPAKVNLRVFAVRVKNGRIEVQAEA